MRAQRQELFKGRHFEAEIIVLCVRWYLRFGLSLRNLEEMMAERSLSVDHVTIWRWVQRYAPELDRRVRPELRRTNAWTLWHRSVEKHGEQLANLRGRARLQAIEGGRPPAQDRKTT
jgi:IS6 family transposase